MDKSTLGDRLKSYEALSTSRQLMPNCPVYARIDGRSFHTFCRGLEKPYSKAFIETMQETCRFLVEETNACLGYVQSDEISLGWENIIKAPFDGRIQKLESNIASLAGAKFVHYIMSHSIENTMNLFNRVEKTIPSFDCRVFNVPNMDELANSFLWRENDAIKNSVSGMALHFYSHRELQNRNTDEKIHMMRMKGHCFYEDTDMDFVRGTYFQRKVYTKELTDEELSKIPSKQLSAMEKNSDGKCVVVRSKVDRLEIPYRLTDIENRNGVLFNNETAVLNKENPTFDRTK